MGFSHDKCSSSLFVTWPCQVFKVWHWRFPPCQPPPAHIPAHLPVMHGIQDRVPQSMPESVPTAPVPGAAAEIWLGCQLFLSLRSSLSYNMERTWKLKQEKQLSGPEGSWGSYGKTARVTTLFIGSLGKTYMVRKTTSSCHKTQLLHGSPKHHQTLKGSCQAREALNNCMLALFFPKHLIGCGFRETVFYVTSGRKAPR